MTAQVELEVSIYVVGVLIFVGSFLALLSSAIFGLGLARLVYVGGHWLRGENSPPLTIGSRCASGRSPLLTLTSPLVAVRAN